MDSDLNQIYRAFGGKLIGNKRMKTFVCQTLLPMTPKTIEYITRSCWFMSSMDDAWGFTFTGDDLKNQHLIFLSDELFYQHAAQIRYSIAHEIGHVMLKHSNSTFEKQTKAEIRKQEKEAHEFASKYFPK